MTDLTRYFSSTVEVATPQTLDVESDTPQKRERIYHNQSHYQVSVSGAGTLLIETKMFGQAAFVPLTTLSDEILILDLIDVEQFRLTATGSDVPTIISPFS